MTRSNTIWVGLRAVLSSCLVGVVLAPSFVQADPRPDECLELPRNLQGLCQAACGHTCLLDPTSPPCAQIIDVWGQRTGLNNPCAPPQSPPPDPGPFEDECDTLNGTVDPEAGAAAGCEGTYCVPDDPEVPTVCLVGSFVCNGDEPCCVVLTEENYNYCADEVADLFLVCAATDPTTETCRCFDLTEWFSQESSNWICFNPVLEPPPSQK